MIAYICHSRNGNYCVRKQSRPDARVGRVLTAKKQKIYWGDEYMYILIVVIFDIIVHICQNLESYT